MYSVPINGPDPIFDDTFSVYPSTLTRKELESVVVLERLDLYNQLLPCGASALKQRLQNLGVKNTPSESAIGRILKKQELMNGYTKNHQ